MNSFILAGALTFNPPNAEILPDKDASRYIAKALYREMELNRIVSEWEDRYIQLDRYPQLAYTGVVVRIVVEKRVTYTWRF